MWLAGLHPSSALPSTMPAQSGAPAHLSSRLKGRTAEGQSAWLKAASSWPRQGTAFFTTAASPCTGGRGEWRAGGSSSSSMRAARGLQEAQAAASLMWQPASACTEALSEAGKQGCIIKLAWQLLRPPACLPACLPIEQSPTCLASTMLHTTWLPAANLERRMLLGTRPSTRDSRWHMAASTSLLASVSGFSRLQPGGGGAGQAACVRA